MREAAELLVQMIGPMLPHLAEDCWERLGYNTLLADQPWPEAEPALLVDDRITIAVQVNGKRRDELTVARTATKDEIEAAALKLETVARALDGRSVNEGDRGAAEDRECRRLRLARLAYEPPEFGARTFPAAGRGAGAVGLRRDGFRPLYGAGCLRRGRRGAAGAGRFRADPGPGRPAHPQRADLPGQRRWRRRPAAQSAPRDRAQGIAHLHAGARSTARRSGQIYAIEASFRLIDVKNKKVVFQGTSHARAGFERFSVDLLERARARGRREPRGQGHCRGPQDPACDVPVARRLSTLRSSEARPARSCTRGSWASLTPPSYG